MHIGVVCSNYPPHPGGLEVMVREISRRLARRHQVTLATSAWADAAGESDEDGIRVHRLRAFHATERLGVPYPVPFGGGIRSALHVLQRCNLIHAHGALYVGSVIASHLRRARRIPFVLTEHVGFVRYRRAIVNAVEKCAWLALGDGVVKSADAVVTYNARVEDWLNERFPLQRTRYIANGVDTDTFRRRSDEERKRLRADFGLPEKGVLAIYVGRETEKKNFDVVRSLPRRDFHLVVCGAERPLSEPGVISLGVIPHSRMPEVFAAVDLMVLPSSGEGFPLAAQEALASAVPLVLLWDEGYRKSLDPSVVVACHALSEIGPAVLRLVADAELRYELSKRGRAWAEKHWNWEGTVAQYEELFIQTVERAQAHP